MKQAQYRNRVVLAGPGAPRRRWPHDGEYALTLGIIRRTILDGLNGGGAHELEWLFTPLAQAGLALLLGKEPDETLVTTQHAVARLTELIDSGRGKEVRKLLIQGSLRQLQEWF